MYKEKQQQIINKIKLQGVLPLFYHDDADICIETIKALYSAGVRLIEFTNRGKLSLDNFKILVNQKNVSMPDLLLGIGTIKTVRDANLFLKAGADFLVSPIFDEDLASFVTQNYTVWIPACMTVSEIHKASNSGFNFIKLFPGSILNPSYLESIKPIFPDLSFMVTGGVDLTKDNLSQWFKSGAAAVGLGSKLITSDILKNRNFNLLNVNTCHVLNTVKELNKYNM